MYWPDLCYLYLFSLGTHDSNMLALFEQSITFTPNTTDVTCCKPDGSNVTATCGGGVSCAAQCFTEGASLCPTQDCNDCFSFNPVGRKRWAYVNTASYNLNHCPRYNCHITRRDPRCCFHNSCRQEKRWKKKVNRRCDLLHNLIGEFVWGCGHKTQLQYLTSDQ